MGVDQNPWIRVETVRSTFDLQHRRYRRLAFTEIHDPETGRTVYLSTVLIHHIPYSSII